MATSQRAFLIELYEEHLQEASFLYEQRRALYGNPEITWKKVGEFEERLEAHIDGLVVGDKLAIEVCKTRAAEGDLGELFAAMCVFCHQDQRDLALAALEQLDPADAEKLSAVADAIKYELPDPWFQDFLTLLASGDPKFPPILARAFGCRRFPCGPQLLSAVRHCATSALPELIWTLGRIAYEPAKGPLLDYLRSEEEPVRAAAAIALARIGEPSVIDYCLDEAPSKAWAILPLGLAGGRTALGPLTELSKKNSDAGIVALGLLGDPVSVPFLISRLEQEDTAPPAAMALQCLTGADLYEAVFVPDEVDEDELFESERERVKQGKTLDRGDGRPFGSNVTRLSQNQDAWTNWWGANQDRFITGTRYRNGGTFSPKRLIETLTAERTPRWLRQYCCEELAIRYGNDFGLETDMPVRSQILRLAEASAWSQSGATRFEEAAWYFGGYRT
jgi:uncharacterized protein (TIGR02270 family)